MRLIFIFLLGTVSLLANQVPNSSFEYGDNIEDILPWVRLRDQSLLMNNKPSWQIDDTAACDGKRSLKGQGTLKFYFESFDKPTGKGGKTFSLYMKAIKADVQVTVRCGFYYHIGRINHISRKFNVGTEWQRFDIHMSRIFGAVRSSSHQVGPVEITIAAPENETVWIDAVQFESGKLTPYRDLPFAIKADSMPMPFQTPLFDSTSISAVAGTSGTYEIAVSGTETPVKNAPLSTAVLFPKGAAGSNTVFALKDQGKEVAADFAPLAVWPQDGSLQSLLVTFSTDVSAEGKRLTLETAAGIPENLELMAENNDGRITVRLADGRQLAIDANAPELWQNITGPNGKLLLGNGILSGFDITDSRFTVKEMTGIIERNGKLSATVLRRGKLINDRDEALAVFSCRILARRDYAGFELEFQLVNTAKKQVSLIKNIYWQATVPELNRLSDATGEIKGDEVYVYTAGNPAKKQFIYGRSIDGRHHSENLVRPLFLQNGDFRLQAINASKTFPAMLATDRNEKTINGYLWPAAPVKTLSLWPGIAMTRNFQLDFASGLSPEQIDMPPLAMPSKSTFAHSNSMINVAAADLEKFPEFERQLEISSFGSFSPQRITAQFAYGMFDYGDHSGDGGWANLESFEDYVLFLRALRSESAELLRQAVVSARHYRDIDTDRRSGLPYMHNVNHVIGGQGFGHAWIQGILTDYLLTGSLRTREAAYQASRALLNLKEADREIQEGRNFGFYLLTLAECYAVFNDPAFLERYRQQLDYQIRKMQEMPGAGAKMMQRTSIPYQNSLFYIKGAGLVPFHCWYGLTGLLRMHELSSADYLPPVIHKELENAMNLEMTYRPQLETHWPGLPAEEIFPAIGTDYLFGRGAFFYPVMAKYSNLTGDEKWRQLGLDIAYAGLLGGRNSGNVQDVFMAAVMTGLPPDFNEENQIKKIRDLLWRGAASTLCNGDFSQSISYRDLVIPKNGIGEPRYPEWAIDKPYPRYWHFVEGKQIISSQFMRYRPNYYELDHEVFGQNAPALKLLLSSDIWHQKNQSLTGAKVQLEPGSWELTMEFIVTKGKCNIHLGIVLTDLGENRGRIQALYNNGKITVSQVGKPAAVCEIAEVIPGSKPGWHKFRIAFSIETRQIGVPLIKAVIESKIKNTEINIDDITLIRK